MPRNYIRKTDRASYPTEKLNEAIENVKNGTLSGYQASKIYAIPRSTIMNRVYGRKGLKSSSLGRATVLPKPVEENLVQNLHYMEKYGFGLTRKELLETVTQYVSKNMVKNPFKNGIPGEDWFLAFKNRNGLSIKKPQAVENERKKACNPQVIYTYFDLLKKTLDELDLHDKPDHIWNVDETSFSKDPSKSKVVGIKGYTSTRTIASPGKDNTTVLLGCNALGQKMPPMIIFKGKNIWNEWIPESDYPGTGYAATPNGWMEAAVFEAFFEKVFLPTVGQKRPILLIYDGHSTHVGINIIEKARAANITILKIPPHTSHLLQPLDLSVNKSFKDQWDVALVKWQRSNVGLILPKKEFAKILGQIWLNLDSSICAAGFRKAGIFPFNKNAVAQDKFNPIALKEWKESQNDGIKIKSPKSLMEIALLSVLHLLDYSNTGIQTQSNIISEQNNNDHPAEKILTTFEELLLKSISAGTKSKSHRKRIAAGAEIITSDEVYKRTKLMEEQKTEKLNKKNKNKVKEPKPEKPNKKNKDKVKDAANTNSLKKKKKENITKASKIEQSQEENTNNNYNFDMELIPEIDINVIGSLSDSTDDDEKKKKTALTKSYKPQTKTPFSKIDVLSPSGDNDIQFNLCSDTSQKDSMYTDLQFDLIQTESEMGIGLQEHKREDENYDTMIDIFDNQTALFQNFTVSKSIIEEPNVTQAILSTKYLVENKENFIINPPPKIQSRAKKNTKKQTKTKNKKRKLSSSSTTTDEDVMSVHTDSDICDVVSIEDEEEEYLMAVPNDYEENDKDSIRRSVDKKEAAIFAQIYEIDRMEKQKLFAKNTLGNNNKKKSEKQIVTRKTSDKNKKQKSKRKVEIRKKHNNKQENEGKEDKTLKSHSKINEAFTYQLGDNILAKYYHKNNWKHYVGSIIEIVEKEKLEITYRVSFYKTVRRNNTLKFIQPKRSDEDCIPGNLIVKEIELIQIKENPNEFVLNDDNDDTYFL